MNYTLNQLRIFLKVATTQSVTKAAEELHLTQPAVSIQLKNFQEQFEIPLIEILNKKIYVTEFGKEIAIAAEKILDEVHAINYKLMSHKGQLTGKLRISIVSNGKYIAPYFFADFIRENPGIELQMVVTNRAQVISSLEKNEVDFSLVSIMPDSASFDKIDLMPNKLFLVGGKNVHQSHKEFDKRIFEKYPLIYREEGSGTRLMMEQFIKKNKWPIQKMMELTSNEAVKQAMIAGLGLSIVPIIGIKNEIQNGELKIIPVKGLPIKTTWNIIWNKEKKFSPAAEAYLKFLRKEKNKIIQENFQWYDSY